MAKKSQRTFLDRALEALGERYSNERPSQSRLARIAGVKQPTVHLWGKGSVPELDTGIAIAIQLNVCVEWLYTERGPKRPGGAGADEHLSPILDVWPSLDAETKRQIARYADFVRDDKPPPK